MCQSDSSTNFGFCQDEVPALPVGAQLPHPVGVGASPWLDRYVEFSRKWSPRSFDGFHEATAIWLLSTVAARRVTFHFGKPRYTNLYVMLCGRTTLHAKSSATDIGRQTLNVCGLDFLLAPDEATPQSFIRSLAGSDSPPDLDGLEPEQRERAEQKLAFVGQTGWYYEEFGSGVASMMRTDGIMADFRSLIRIFDDCPPEYSRSTISRGIECVKRPYLALIANLTPADLKPVAKRGTQLWGDGFLARFAFITPPLDEVLDGRFPKGRRVIPPELAQPLVEWHRRLGIPKVTVKPIYNDDDKEIGRRAVVTPLSSHTLKLPDEVLNAQYAYHDGLLEIARSSDLQDLDGNYGRLAEKSLRVAALLASLDKCDQVQLKHLARAQKITERWRLYTHRLYNQVTQMELSEEAMLEDKICEVVMRWQDKDNYVGGLTAAEIKRFVRGLSTPQAKFISDRLVDGGVLSKHRPKKAERYYIPKP